MKDFSSSLNKGTKPPTLQLPSIAVGLSSFSRG
jgi:hypothetical protein